MAVFSSLPIALIFEQITYVLSSTIWMMILSESRSCSSLSFSQRPRKVRDLYEVTSLQHQGLSTAQFHSKIFSQIIERAMMFSATFQTLIFFKVDSILSSQEMFRSWRMVVSFFEHATKNFGNNIYLYRFYITVISYVPLRPDTCLSMMLLILTK